LFPIAKRCEMAAHALAHLPNVRVLELTGLTVEFAQQQGASCLVRGIRSVTDYDYESSVAEVNWQLSQGAMETIFVPTHAEFACVSSSVVRELILIQAFDALERFLPKAVLLEVLNRGS